jgi:NADPH:quinone reductase-like Zn-dependent oxidoreductase
MSSTFESALEMPQVGGPERLRLVPRPTQEPGQGQLRLRVRAAGVGATDLMILAGRYGFAPKPPVIPGYEVAGVVDAVGPGVAGWRAGMRAAALTVHGGFATTLVRDAGEFAPIPAGVRDVDAAAVILNHVSAWQMVHRVAKVTAGDTALVTAAGGGLGTALLQQLRLAGARTFGAASERRRELIERLGATALNRHEAPADRLIARELPGGVDHVFDGVGFGAIPEALRALKRGGGLVAFGFMGGGGRLATGAMFARLFGGALLRGRRASFYGITLRYRNDPAPFHADLAQVFDQLERGLIDPLIDAVLPLEEGPAALARLAAGNVHGKLVLTP